MNGELGMGNAELGPRGGPRAASPGGFWRRVLAARSGDLSSTRLCLLAVTFTLCALVWALIFATVRTGSVPDVPAGTGLFLGALIGVVATLKGVQNKDERNE